MAIIPTNLIICFIAGVFGGMITVTLILMRNLITLVATIHVSVKIAQCQIINHHFTSDIIPPNQLDQMLVSISKLFAKLMMDSLHQFQEYELI
jgi:hypothetical protein